MKLKMQVNERIGDNNEVHQKISYICIIDALDILDWHNLQGQ